MILISEILSQSKLDNQKKVYYKHKLNAAKNDIRQLSTSSHH